MYQRKNEKTNEKYVEMNENETTTYQSMMDVAKAVLSISSSSCLCKLHSLLSDVSHGLVAYLANIT